MAKQNTVEAPKIEQFGTKPSVHYSEVVCFQRLTSFIKNFIIEVGGTRKCKKKQEKSKKKQVQHNGTKFNRMVVR